MRLLIIVALLGSSLVSGQGWNQYTIDASSAGADGVKLADINQDGLIDLVTGWEEGGLTKLYINPGLSMVKKEWPSVITGYTASVEDAVFADMNDDGYLDIVSCTEKNSERIYIHFFNGQDCLNTKNWKQAILPASEDMMMWMYAEPLQIDGQFGVDLIAGGKNENGQLGWFEAPKLKTDLEGWKWHSISPIGWVMSILLRDMDSDGDMDIVVTDRRSKLQGCRWLENPGIYELQKMPWKNHFIGAKGLEVMFMTMADVDGDGIEEAVLTERTDETIRIYRHIDKSGLEWTEKIIHIPASTGRAKSIEVGDINGDGQNDLVLSTNTIKDKKVGLTWLDGKNLEHITDADFKAISAFHVAKYDKVELVDIDGDGDSDVLICEENYGQNSQGLGVIWYENPTKK